MVLASGLLVACGSGSEEGSDQFRDQTKDPLLDFGEEGSGAELSQGEEVVRAFLAARGAGNWSRACAQLSREMLDKIEHLAVSSTNLGDKSCPSFLGTFIRLSAKERKETKVEAGGSLRRQGRNGYLIYYGNGEVVYAMPLGREGDAWKVASLSPQRLG